MIDSTKPYGVKLFIIDRMSWNDLREVVDAIKEKGYSATFNDNGSVTLEKVKE